MNSRSLRIAVSVAVSLVFLAFAVRNVDWAEALRALRTANYLWVLPTLPITVWTLYIRAQRWRVFLHGVGVPPMRLLVSATNIGFMANMVLPLRVGEVIRPVLVSRRQGLPLSGVLASVLLERIFDMFTILILFGLSTALVPISEDVQQWGRVLTALAFGVASLIALIRWKETLALDVARRLCDLLPEAAGHAAFGFVTGFVRALDMLDSPAIILRAFVWSFYLWIVIASIYTFCFVAFDLPVPMFTASLVLTTVVAIAVSVPSAPGFIGSFQLACVLGLAIFLVPESRAIAFSIVVHITQFIGVIGAGLYSLWSENMSLREMEDLEQEDGAAA